METYALVKLLHIVSATILFGTGLGIAFFMLCGHLSGEVALRRFAATFTVRADFLFTLPAVIIQPLSGAWLLILRGFAWDEFWLVATYVLYLLAGACWVPVVVIQMRMKSLLERAPHDDAALARLFRWWFILGWPAFGSLVVIFYLMVAKPSW